MPQLLLSMSKNSEIKVGKGLYSEIYFDGYLKKCFLKPSKKFKLKYLQKRSKLVFSQASFSRFLHFCNFSQEPEWPASFDGNQLHFKTTFTQNPKVFSSCNHYLKAFVVKLTRSNLPLLQAVVFTFVLN